MALDDNPIFGDPSGGDEDDGGSSGGSSDSSDGSSSDSGFDGRGSSGGSSDGGGFSVGDDDSSSSSSSSSGGSSSSSSDPTDPDNAKNVIVSGGGSSSEPQTIVGTGDTESEAKIDAATNQNFDAAEGTEIDSLEERLGSDPRRTGKSVTVTGGAGSRQEQTVVGTGESRFESEARAARNPRFDADEGTRVDALETAMDQGQADGTDALQPLNRRNINRRKGENVDSRVRGNERLAGVERTASAIRGNNVNPAPSKNDNNRMPAEFTDFQTFINPFDGNPNADFSEEALSAGVDLMNEGSEFGDRVSNATVGRFTDFTDDLFSPRFVDESGREVELSDEQEEAFQTDAVSFADDRVEASGDIAETFGSGVASGPSQIAGLALATPGAVQRSFEEDTPSFGQGVSAGPELLFDEVSDNPGEFLAEEAGEEVGEAIAGALVAGPAGLVAGAVPSISPEVSPEVSRSVGGSSSSPFSSSESTQSQDLLQEEASNVEAEDLPSFGQSLERDSNAQRIRGNGQDFVPERASGDSVRSPEQGFTQNELEVLAGREVGPEDVDPRFQTESGGFDQQQANVLRQERNTVEDAADPVENLFDSDAIGSLVGGLLPPETETTSSPDVEPELNPPEQDVSFDEDLSVFGDRPQGFDRSGRSFSGSQNFESDASASLESEINPFIDSDAPQEQAFEQSQGQDQAPEFDQEFEPENEFVFDFNQNPDTTPGAEPVPENSFDNLIDSNPEATFEPELSPDSSREFDGGDSNGNFVLEDSRGDFVGFENEGEFAESLTASLQGIEASDDFDEESFVGTGFDIRPLL